MPQQEQGFRTAAEKAHEIISKKILSGELQPGCKLSRRKMAAITGVSVIPVIEALKHLEEDGLVESKPQWGSFVVMPTAEKIKDIYVLREAIECQVARILAQNMSEEQRSDLYRIAGELDGIKYTEQTSTDMNELHYQFHSKMAEYTNYQSLITSLRRINLFWVLCKAVSNRRKSPISNYWHRQLVDEIASGDPERAEAMMRIHVYDSLNAILCHACKG